MIPTITSPFAAAPAASRPRPAPFFRAALACAVYLSTGGIGKGQILPGGIGGPTAQAGQTGPIIPPGSVDIYMDENGFRHVHVRSNGDDQSAAYGVA